MCGMARVVAVHGAFNELWGPHEIAARWLPALRDGLWKVGASIDDGDFAVCFYGDLFRHDPEREDPDAVAATRAGAAELLASLPGGDVLDHLQAQAGAAMYDRTLDLVAAMADKEELAEQVTGRVLAVVGPDTRVIVAHSLGTLISYRALCLHPEWGVDTFVTLGSPLGNPMMRAALYRGAAQHETPWPGSIRRWVNVAAVGDVAASIDRLAPVFDARVEDRRVDNGHRAHDPEPYLNAAVTGEAVAAALTR
jgi:pimeloyl-ACP methyl ester carboxylesterase